MVITLSKDWRMCSAMSMYICGCANKAPCLQHNCNHKWNILFAAQQRDIFLSVHFCELQQSSVCLTNDLHFSAPLKNTQKKKGVQTSYPAQLMNHDAHRQHKRTDRPGEKVTRNSKKVGALFKAAARCGRTDSEAQKRARKMTQSQVCMYQGRTSS